MGDDIHLMIEALESYTGLPWDYLKIAHPSIEKLFKRCADIISRDDLIEISKTICDRCTMGDKLCDAIMNLLSEKRDLQPTCNQLATDCISRQAAIDAIDKYSVWVMYTQGDSQNDEAELVENIIKQTKKAIQSMLKEDLPSAQPETHEKRTETHACDCISRQYAIANYQHVCRRTSCKECPLYICDESRGFTDCELELFLHNLPSAQPEPLTDKEQRIFLAAMEREEKVCEEVDRNYVREPYEDSLMRVCKEIRRKVKGALWT